MVNRGAASLVTFLGICAVAAGAQENAGDYVMLEGVGVAVRVPGGYVKDYSLGVDGGETARLTWTDEALAGLTVIISRRPGATSPALAACEAARSWGNCDVTPRAWDRELALAAHADDVADVAFQIADDTGVYAARAVFAKTANDTYRLMITWPAAVSRPGPVADEMVRSFSVLPPRKAGDNASVKE